MTYRNYSLNAERLMPLQYSDDKKSIRVWISKSTSLDRVITITQGTDSTYSGNLIVFGHKIDDHGKKYGYYKTALIKPSSGYANFLKRVDSLSLNSYQDQKDFEVVYDYPVEIYIVEYLHNGKYTKFIFQPNLLNSTYQIIEKFIESEFKLIEILK